MHSARHWLVTQHGRPPERIARSYRKRYGVDWAGAIAELSMLGIVFDPKWRKQLERSLEVARRAKWLGKERTAAEAFPDSDEDFAFIAGYTEGGAPFGTTWEEQEELERATPLEQGPPKTDAPVSLDAEPWPF